MFCNSLYSLVSCTLQVSKERSSCPIAKTLDVVGDKWSLVLIRDLLVGKKRFQEFLASPERITTSILTARLRRLEACGFLTKEPYQDNPTRYEYVLTGLGESLLPVLQAICRWANEQFPDTYQPPSSFMSRKPATSTAKRTR